MANELLVPGETESFSNYIRRTATAVALPRLNQTDIVTNVTIVGIAASKLPLPNLDMLKNVPESVLGGAALVFFGTVFGILPAIATVYGEMHMPPQSPEQPLPTKR